MLSIRNSQSAFSRARLAGTAAAIILSLVLGACGGSDSPPTGPPDNGNPPPPPNTTPGPPARVVIQAGNGQRGDPGAALPVSPKVLVTDSAGKAVSGVGVVFRVDSGGGTVTTPSASTATDGTASAGTWLLGNTEGSNVLVATVGSLPPVRFSAIAEVSISTVAQQNVAAGGGTLNVTQGILSGTKIVLPPSALPAASWTLGQKPVSTWPATENVTPVGAVLHITSTATGVAATPITVTLPAPTPEAGTKSFVIMRNTAGSGMQVLQTVSSEDGLITAATTNFDPGTLTTAAAGRFNSLFDGTASAGSGYDVDVVVANIPVAKLDGDVDTGFRPGTDDWDFPMLPTSYGNVATVAGTPTEVGAAISQMVYFASLKSARGALTGRYRGIKSVGETNRVGFHSAAYTSHSDALGNLIASVRTIRTSMRATMVDQTFHDVLKANMIVTGLPQLMVATYGDDQWIPLTAYRVVSGRVDVANPFRQGTTESIQFSSGAFEKPSLVRSISGNTGTPDWIGATAIGQWINTSKLAGNLNTIIDGGEPGGVSTWPRARLETRGGLVDDTSLVLVDDSVRFWFTCNECKTSTVSVLTAQGVEPFVGIMVDGNGNPASQFNGQGDVGALAEQTGPISTRIGFVNFESATVSDVSWLDFKWYKVYKWVLDWTEKDMVVRVGEDTTLSVTVNGPAAPDHRFRWTIGSSGDDQQVITTDSPTVSVVFAKDGETPIMAEMLRKSDGRVIARVSGKVTTTQKPWAAWRITSFQTVERFEGLRHTTMPQTSTSYWSSFLGGTWLGGPGPTQYLLDRIVWDSSAMANIEEGRLPGAIVFLSRDASGEDGEPVPSNAASVHGVYLVTGQRIPEPSGGFPPIPTLQGGDLQFGSAMALAIADSIRYIGERPGQPNSCNPLFQYYYNESGNLLNGKSGTIRGLYWSWIGGVVQWFNEPVAARSIEITSDDGETLTGTITLVFRLNKTCPTDPIADRQVPWYQKYGFQAKRMH